MTKNTADESLNKTARVTGVLFIVATVASLLSTGFTGAILDAPDYLARMSENKSQVVIGALLQFVAAATSAGIAISLYPVLRKYNEGLALGAVGFRLVEAVFYIVAALSLVALLPLSQQYINAGAPTASYFQTLGTLVMAMRNWASFVFGVFAFCLGALMHYYVFYQSKLIPRWLAAWGFIGAALLLSAAIAIMFGDKTYYSGITILFLLPIAVQEIVLAVWLIVKGFNPSAISSGFVK
jgi:hypothetical protein